MSSFRDRLALRYPSCYSKTTEKSQVFRIPSHLGIHPFTLNALKNVTFSGYSLTCVFDLFTRKALKNLYFSDIRTLKYVSRCTKSTQKCHLLRILHHLCIQQVTPKAFKNINFTNIRLLGYRSRYTKSTEKCQLFTIPSPLGIHLATPKVLKSFNFSGYLVTWVSIS